MTIEQLNNQGRELTDSGRYREALDLHLQALAMLPKGEERGSEYYETNRYIGENYCVVGEYALAESHYFDSCRSGQDGIYSHDDNYHYFIFMGDLSMSRSQSIKALEYYTTAREIRLKYNNCSSLEVAEIDIIIGEYYHSIGDLDRAIRWFDSASNTYDNLVEYDSIENVRYYTVLGAVLRDMGLEERSLETLESAYRICQRLGSKCDIECAAVLENMALTLSDEQIDRVDEAVKRLEQAIKIYQDHYPDNHHYIASVYNIWGTILMGDNRAAEAMDLYYIALRIQRETLSEIHFDLADTYINLGTSSLQQGDLDRAMKYYTYAEQIEGSVYHKGHCHKALGCMALIESRFEDAHRELHRALDIYSQHIDKMQIDIIETECYINDLRQRIESAINEDIYMDSEKIIYGVKSDDYGILYTSDLRTILSVPQQIGRSLIGYSKASSSGSYIECYNSVCIPIPESVIAISASAFANNEGLNRVSLPNVTSVERLAFEGCSSLSEVQFADNVTLKSDAFKGCVNIIP